MSASLIRAAYISRITFCSKSPICQQLRRLLLTVLKMHICTDDGALMLESMNAFKISLRVQGCKEGGKSSCEKVSKKVLKKPAAVLKRPSAAYK